MNFQFHRHALAKLTGRPLGPGNPCKPYNKKTKKTIKNIKIIKIFLKSIFLVSIRYSFQKHFTDLLNFATKKKQQEQLQKNRIHTLLYYHTYNNTMDEEKMVLFEE